LVYTRHDELNEHVSDRMSENAVQTEVNIYSSGSSVASPKKSPLFSRIVAKDDFAGHDMSADTLSYPVTDVLSEKSESTYDASLDDLLKEIPISDDEQSQMSLVLDSLSEFEEPIGANTISGFLQRLL
jgi:hypothetical protein